MGSITNTSKDAQGVAPKIGRNISENGQEQSSHAAYFPIAEDDEASTDFDELDTYGFPGEEDEDDAETDQANQHADAPSVTGGNKFLYPEFSGFRGYDYLKSIVIQIIPRALAQTWQAAVSYQAPNNTCYVSSERLLRDKRIKAQDERTLRKHWQTMRKMGLATFQACTKVITDKRGSHAAIVVDKDFTGLYDLAHEFHEWSQSHYQHFPPRRDVAPELLKHQELARKLVRFDCYRRVLLTDAPGPKSPYSLCIDDPETRSLRNALAAEVDLILQNGVNRNIYPDTFPDGHTQDRRNLNSSIKDISTINTNGSADLKKIFDAPPRAIRSQEQPINTEAQKGTETPQGTNEIETKPNEKREVLMNVPAAVPEIPEIEVVDGKRILPDAYRQRLERLKPTLEALPAWDELITELFPLVRLWLNDQATTELHVVNNGKSFFRKRNELDPLVIYRSVCVALEKAYAIPEHDIQKRNTDATRSANWMPKFMRQLEYAVIRASQLVKEEQAAVEASSLEEQEPLTAEVSPDPENTEQEAADMIQDFLHEAELYQVAVSEEQHARIIQHDDEAITELTTRLHEAVVTRETDDRWSEHQRDACRQITRACQQIEGTGAHHRRLKIFDMRCPRGCGGHIGYVADNDECYCILCIPSYQWDQSLQQQIQTIMHRLPSYSEVAAQVEYEFFGDPGRE